MNPVIKGLLDIAETELQVAEELLDRFPAQAGFNLQQAAEKMMKAALLKEGIGFPRLTHHLDELVGKLPADHLWRGDFLPLTYLASQAVANRCPTASGGVAVPLPRAKMKASLNEMKAIFPEFRGWCDED